MTTHSAAPPHAPAPAPVPNLGPSASNAVSPAPGQQSPAGSLERRIAAALQANGRATWRAVAHVLAEPERTVTRHGTAMLAARRVVVTALRSRASAALLRLACAPGRAPAAAAALAERGDVTFSSLVTGGADCVVELSGDAASLESALAGAAAVGLDATSTRAYPVLRYFRTVRGWRLAPLSAESERELTRGQPADPPPLGAGPALSVVDERVVEALVEDGRASFEAIARRAGISESTARRRTEWLFRGNRLQVRGLVEPRDFGLTAEAILWISCPPGRVEAVGRALAAQQAVRYAAAVAGDCQLVAGVAVAHDEALYRFVTESPWVHEVDRVETSLVLSALKRGGRLVGAGL